MSVIKSFEEIKAWQHARVLSNKIYLKSIEGMFARDWALRDQINRASGSIMDNIAEGFERNGNKEFINFLSMSKGSAGEVRSQLIRALDRHYISKEEFEDLKNQSLDISRMLSSLISYLIKANRKGFKFG